MNQHKQKLLLYLLSYFKSRKGEHRVFNKRQLWLAGVAAAYILIPDDYLFEGISKIGLLDDLAIIVGCVIPTFLSGSAGEGE